MDKQEADKGQAIYFRGKEVKCGTFRVDEYRWIKLMKKDSGFVTIHVESHNMVPIHDAILNAQWTNRTGYAGYEMLHSVQISITDFYSNSIDDWIVTFASKGQIHYGGKQERIEKVLTRTLRKVNDDDEEIPWYW